MNSCTLQKIFMLGSYLFQVLSNKSFMSFIQPNYLLSPIRNQYLIDVLHHCHILPSRLTFYFSQASCC